MSRLPDRYGLAGFALTLEGGVSEGEVIAALETLFDSGWVDRHTRSIVIELNWHAARPNLRCASVAA